MTYVLDITSANFDGATVVSLAGVQINPATEQFVYTFPAVGRIPLWTGPFNATDLWIQEISLSAGIVATLRFPNGLVWPTLDNWNLLVPQGTELRLSGGAGSATIYARGVSTEDWHRFQCCHQFAPTICVPPEILSVGVNPATGGAGTDITVTGGVFLPTDIVSIALVGPGTPAVINSVVITPPGTIVIDADIDAGTYELTVARFLYGETCFDTFEFEVQAA